MGEGFKKCKKLAKGNELNTDVAAFTGPASQILHAEGERRGAGGEAPPLRRRELGRVQGAGGGAAHAQGEHSDFRHTQDHSGVKGSVCFVLKFAFPPFSPPPPLECESQNKTRTEPF